MGYQLAMEAAGAKVLAYKAFGSYQGDWYAKVAFKGTVGFVQGSYGSCSGCDSFQGEFGYDDPACSEHEYTYNDQPCADCDVKKAEYQVNLAAFGASYLDNMQTYEEVLQHAKRNEDWDMEATTMVEWLEANK